MEFLLHISLKKDLFSILCTALLLVLTTSAEEVKDSQCHNYAGGHVYPGEAFRVPVSDHSLHLSKAKSEFLSWVHPEVLFGICIREVRIDLSFWQSQLLLQLQHGDLLSGQWKHTVCSLGSCLMGCFLFNLIHS